ncbi:hypothetical protein KI809_13720 [Geobacter pelophilus]|jgi:hypothetical protein|uniref:GTPase n=1 Tax=Geoanaerobacter pelophilus TaxID=60036 RepID=A0AAW4L766_9BACT|nr:hypothetical protein [Geoanaerobacter pelophilus]MBT0665360.1 hypothetical protein [Geoanaerobacter pelophilus]
MRPYLVFVYNADSGVFNTLTDIAHKVFSPETYSCNLCAITYGNFSIRAEWKEFLESLDADLEFLHRDELHSSYGVAGAELPAVFTRKGDVLNLWIKAAEINGCSTMEELKTLILTRLASGTAEPSQLFGE